MSRFDYVQYDEIALNKQTAMKQKFEELMELADREIGSCRAKALFVTAMEEGYMWVGKAIRDDQLDRQKNDMSYGNA